MTASLDQQEEPLRRRLSFLNALNSFIRITFNWRLAFSITAGMALTHSALPFPNMEALKQARAPTHLACWLAHP